MIAFQRLRLIQHVYVKPKPSQSIVAVSYTHLCGLNRAGLYGSSKSKTGWKHSRKA